MSCRLTPAACWMTGSTLGATTPTQRLPRPSRSTTACALLLWRRRDETWTAWLGGPRATAPAGCPSTPGWSQYTPTLRLHGHGAAPSWSFFRSCLTPTSAPWPSPAFGLMRAGCPSPRRGFFQSRSLPSTFSGAGLPSAGLQVSATLAWLARHTSLPFSTMAATISNPSFPPAPCSPCASR